MSPAAIATTVEPRVRAETAPTVDPPATVRRWTDVLRRPVAAALILGALYLALSFAMAPAGEVADVGGKLATLRVMDAHDSWAPDVGYWAAGADPSGSLHPLAFTDRIGHTWAQVTTLPMLYAAFPLYRLGGPHAVVLLPILGALGCAFAARALARRLGGGDGWVAYWAVGLATPVAVYAVSFWEHTVGLALMLWALVGLLDVQRGRAGTRRALGAGLLLGAAATMRTEALVYAAVGTLVVCVAMATSRRWRAAVTAGLAVVAGLVAVLVANQLVERLAFGAGRRSARVAGTAGEAVSAAATRFDLATTSFTGISGFTVSIDWVVGALAVGLAVVGVLLARSPARRVDAFACVAFGATLYVLRFTTGLGFVPGLLTASPLAAVGIVMAWRRTDLRLVGVLACAPIPVVWATQYADTMRPQWGARYLFASGVLLAVVAVVVLRRSRVALATALVAGAVVTVTGLAFVVERSHSIADGTASVLATAPAVVSMDPHFFRETGARYDPDAHWLTAETDDELHRAVAVLAHAGNTTVAVVAPRHVALPDEIGRFHAGPVRVVTTRPGESLELRRYHAP